MQLLSRTWSISWSTYLVLALLVSLPAPVGAHTEPSGLLRHAAEDRALVEPQAVLAELPALLAQAERNGDTREQALLLLARANACRVIADLRCQRDAGAAARVAAQRSGEVKLEVRGLIVEGRALMAQQDYSQGERLLGDAELRLGDAPDEELSADIDLGYSSLSHALGKHALALEYAQRGLKRLSDGQHPALQVRLLRNNARALIQLGRFDEAAQLLARALAIRTPVADPKLRAELFLEQARLARQRSDVAAAQRSADEVIALAAELRNGQLAGQGHEVIGLVASDARDLQHAQRELELAVASFRAHDLTRDELRATRSLLLVMLDAKRPGEEREPVTRRYLTIEAGVIAADRAQAADDFDARLKYAQRETDVLRLESEAMLAQERERRGRLLNIAGIVTVAMLSLFFLLQVHSNRRLRKALQAQRVSESRATDLLRLSTGYVFLHDLDGRLLMMNPAAAEAVGRTPEMMVGRDVRELIPEDGHAAFEAYLDRIRSRGEAEGTVRVRRADGGERHWRYGNRLSRVDPEYSHVVGMAVDVTDQVEQNETLRERSERDALTGSYNRRYLAVFERRVAADDVWGVVNVDLDHFKQVNDMLGHEHGDRVLVDFARFLRRHVREDDAVVRTGGDEFLLLIADASEAGLAALIERVQEDAAQAPCAFSLGWARRSNGEALADTLARADQDMYARRRVRRGGEAAQP